MAAIVETTFLKLFVFIVWFHGIFILMVSADSGNCLARAGNKPLFKPMMTQLYDTIWHRWVAMRSLIVVGWCVCIYLNVYYSHTVHWHMKLLIPGSSYSRPVPILIKIFVVNRQRNMCSWKRWNIGILCENVHNVCDIDTGDKICFVKGKFSILKSGRDVHQVCSSTRM